MIEATSTRNVTHKGWSSNLAADKSARKEASLYDNVIKQLDKAADLMRLDPNIKKILEKTRVRAAARELGTEWRAASYVVALSHLERVYKERGIFP